MGPLFVLAMEGKILFHPGPASIAHPSTSGTWKMGLDMSLHCRRAECLTQAA